VIVQVYVDIFGDLEQDSPPILAYAYSGKQWKQASTKSICAWSLAIGNRRK
jgi:hypothetical protein